MRRGPGREDVVLLGPFAGETLQNKWSWRKVLRGVAKVVPPTLSRRGRRRASCALRVRLIMAMVVVGVY